MHSPKRYPPEWAKIVSFRPKHPKLDQNMQFTPLSETTGISVTFMWEFPSPPRVQNLISTDKDKAEEKRRS